MLCVFIRIAYSNEYTQHNIIVWKIEKKQKTKTKTKKKQKTKKKKKKKKKKKNIAKLSPFLSWLGVMINS